MPPSVRIELVRKMADIEHRLAYGTSDRLQLGALCGAFAGARSAGVRVGGRWALGVGAASARVCALTPAPCATLLLRAEAKEGIVAAAK